MKELMTMGTTVLFVSHSLPQIEEMCDKVIWIEEHKIKEIGKTKEICEKYQQYWIKEELDTFLLKILLHIQESLHLEKYFLFHLTLNQIQNLTLEKYGYDNCKKYIYEF